LLEQTHGCDLVFKLVKPGHDGGAATTRKLGRTLRLRICIDRGLYAGHKTVVRLLLEREQIPRQQLMATEMRCCTR
jgi:hypothetical protein